MKELSAAYIPRDNEDVIYALWENSGYFNPDNLPGERTSVFSVSMPPPNVTGVLHLGHALENALMDTAVRYQRLRGKKVLLVPGTDHAAVATQAKVEKILMEEGIKDPRKELGREELLKRIREYAEQSKKTILTQIRKMGTSCDWSRLAYTFDDQRSSAVNKIFLSMYRDGLISRGYRVINWSVKGQSTCSDDELVYIERTATVYTFKYAKDFPIAIATTRPETKLGDTAVAVHPEDERYQQYIGKTYTADVGAEKPLSIKIIADADVDKNFGTGAVGVTPAHSMVDYEMSLRHELPLIQVIGMDGTMTEKAGAQYKGLIAEKARTKFVAWLREEGLMIREEESVQNVSTHERFGDITEVLPMTQWFVNVNTVIPGKGKSLKDLMRDAVARTPEAASTDSITITPERFTKTYFQWVDNLRDWCISRQIWWGHRIPIWYCNNCDAVTASEHDPKTCTQCSGTDLKQDEDTLDTWFSSGLWTFSTLGWPNNTKDLKEFHPTTWMQMGYEILFFWMARMILMSTYATNQIPFHDVYIHGMLRDKNGKKFSKSMGTGIDPIKIIETYGTDALRISLIAGITPGNDAKFYEEKVAGARNFVNKLWNISRFILTSTKEPASPEKPKPITLADTWILSRFDAVCAEITKNLEQYEFSYAHDTLKSFTWDDFADWYIEIAKTEGSKDAILRYLLNKLLILWHPFAPFITEHINRLIHPDEILMIATWPKVNSDTVSEKSAEDFVLIKKIVEETRSIKADYRLSATTLKELIVRASPRLIDLIRTNEAIIQKLAHVSTVTLVEDVFTTKTSAQKIISAECEIIIPLAGLLDVTREKERITEEQKKLNNILVQIEERLSNTDFTRKAPEQVIAAEKDRRAEITLKIKKMDDQIHALHD